MSWKEGGGKAGYKEKVVEEQGGGDGSWKSSPPSEGS